MILLPSLIWNSTELKLAKGLKFLYSSGCGFDTCCEDVHDFIRWPVIVNLKGV